jgi:hypothetical protein
MDQRAAHVAERLAGQRTAPSVHRVGGLDPPSETTIGELTHDQAAPVLHRLIIGVAHRDDGGVPAIDDGAGLGERQGDVGVALHGDRMRVLRRGSGLAGEHRADGSGLLAPQLLELADLLYGGVAVEIDHPLAETAGEREGGQAGEDVGEVLAGEAVDRHAGDMLAADDGRFAGIGVLPADHAVEIVAVGRQHQRIRFAGGAVMQVVDQLVLKPLAPEIVHDLVGLHPAQAEQAAHLILELVDLPLEGLDDPGEGGRLLGGLVGVEGFRPLVDLLARRRVADDQDALVLEMLAFGLELLTPLLVDGGGDGVGKVRGVARRVLAGGDAARIGPDRPVVTQRQQRLVDAGADMRLRLVAG